MDKIIGNVSPGFLKCLFFACSRSVSYAFTSVAARLRSLRTDDPLRKGHPRSIKQQLEL